MSIRQRSWGFDRFSGLYLLALFIIVFGLWNPGLFLSLDTLHFIASQQAIVAMLALAVLVPLAAGSYDLSVGANINIAAVMVAVLQTRHEMPMWTSILITVLASAAIGAFNGFVVVKLRVNSFIATLGCATLIGAGQTILTGGSQPFPPVSAEWSALTQTEIGGFQIVVVYSLILALIIWWFLARTPAGRYIYAIGSNPDAARLSGVAVGKWTFLSLTISGTICGIAGVFYASLAGPSLTFGASMLLPAFAAVFLGSTQLVPGRFNVWGTLLAIFVLAVGVQGLQLITSVQWLSAVFNGAALILAVALAGQRRRQVADSQTRTERSGGSDPLSDSGLNGSGGVAEPPRVSTRAEPAPSGTTVRSFREDRLRGQ